MAERDGKEGGGGDRGLGEGRKQGERERVGGHQRDIRKIY